MRLIDADALKRKAQRVATESWKMKITARIEIILNQFIDWIDDTPTIHPERKGQWIPSDSELEIRCNKCGKDFGEYVCSMDYVFLAERPKFCPNCGAKMEEVSKNDN